MDARPRIGVIWGGGQTKESGKQKRKSQASLRKSLQGPENLRVCSLNNREELGQEKKKDHREKNLKGYWGCGGKPSRPGGGGGGGIRAD